MRTNQMTASSATRIYFATSMLVVALSFGFAAQASGHNAPFLTCEDMRISRSEVTSQQVFASVTGDFPVARENSAD